MMSTVTPRIQPASSRSAVTEAVTRTRTECDCPDDCGVAPFYGRDQLHGRGRTTTAMVNFDCEDTDCVDDPVCSVTCELLGITATPATTAAPGFATR